MIVCVDCGGRAHLLTHPPEDGQWEPGDIVELPLRATASTAGTSSCPTTRADD